MQPTHTLPLVLFLFTALTGSAYAQGKAYADGDDGLPLPGKTEQQLALEELAVKIGGSLGKVASGVGPEGDALTFRFTDGLIARVRNVGADTLFGQLAADGIHQPAGTISYFGAFERGAYEGPMSLSLTYTRRPSAPDMGADVLVFQEQLQLGSCVYAEVKEKDRSATGLADASHMASVVQGGQATADLWKDANKLSRDMIRASNLLGVGYTVEETESTWTARRTSPEALGVNLLELRQRTPNSGVSVSGPTAKGAYATEAYLGQVLLAQQASVLDDILQATSGGWQDDPAGRSAILEELEGGLQGDRNGILDSLEMREQLERGGK